MMCAVASIGAIMLWDVGGGLMKIDKYLYMQNENIRVRCRLLFRISISSSLTVPQGRRSLSHRPCRDQGQKRIRSRFGTPL